MCLTGLSCACVQWRFGHVTNFGNFNSRCLTRVYRCDIDAYIAWSYGACQNSSKCFALSAAECVWHFRQFTSRIAIAYVKQEFEEYTHLSNRFAMAGIKGYFGALLNRLTRDRNRTKILKNVIIVRGICTKKRKIRLSKHNLIHSVVVTVWHLHKHGSLDCYVSLFNLKAMHYPFNIDRRKTYYESLNVLILI